MVKLNERKKSEELRELLGLEPVSLMTNKSRLIWFGHVEQKDDNDWVKHMMWEVEGIRQRGRPKRPDGIVLRMTWKDAQSRFVCLFVCLGFNGTFSTNRLYRAITVG